MITSLHNSQVQAAKKLLKRAVRAEKRQFLVEGARAVGEALQAKAPIQALFVDRTKGAEIAELASLARSLSVSVHEASAAVMKSISATTSPPGIVGVCGFVDIDPTQLIKRRLSLITVLGQVRDPGNAGTILRTCRAAGVDGVFVTSGTVDVYNPKLVRATAGALFSIPWARDVQLRWLLDELGHRRINRVAADPRGDAVYDQIDMAKPTAFLVGNEAWGLPSDLSAPVDAKVSIPMSASSESLNVAVAAAVLLFEAARQRRNLAVFR